MSRGVVLLGAVLATHLINVPISLASDETFTQIGSVACKTDWRTAPGYMIQCPDVKFPQPFGAPPNLIVFFNSFGYYDRGDIHASFGGSVTPSATGVSAVGFKTKVTEDAPPNIPYVLNWIAVGPHLP